MTKLEAAQVFQVIRAQKERRYRTGCDSSYGMGEGGVVFERLWGVSFLVHVCFKMQHELNVQEGAAAL